MRKYRLGYIAWRNQLTPQDKIKGKYFTAAFTKDHKDYEVVLNATNYQNARKASQLITSALSLLDGCTSLPLESIPRIIPLQKGHEDVPIFHFGCEQTNRTLIPKAVKMAAKASFKRKHFISLLKYQLACELHSVDLMDLYPEYFKLSKNHSDHLRFAYAIVVFYSVLEELGLEIRANKDNPSKVDGKWNPEVKSELEGRLLRAKIDINDKVNWHLRSTPTKIERLNKPEVQKKSSWARDIIRDSEINIIDAIAYASWTRSRIASHKLNVAFTSLSIYDVANINFLARRLLLETIGFLDKQKSVD